MYCFPYPQGPASATPLRVPYLATLTYSLFGTYTFGTFPGYIMQNKFPELPPSLIQTWLFFGLASEALGRDVPHNEFFDNQAVGSPSGSIDLRIPIWFWSELTARWTDLAKSLSTEEYQRARQALKDNHDLAMIALCLWDEPLGGAVDEGDTELALVLLSVHMLLYLIQQVFGTQKVLRTTVCARSTQLLIRAAVSRGWCRKRLNFVESVRTFYPALYFLCSSPLPHGNRGDHSSCTPTKCQVVTTLAKPNHRKHCRRCRTVKVPLDPVLRIIAEDGIPLIRIARLPSGKIQLQVVPYTRTLRFVAVSHVWADRQLGSTKNGLPNCQVEYLNSVLTKLPNLGVSISEILPLGRWGFAQHYEYFWLDTFCIPQAPEHADLRNKAIGSMNLIYAAAAQTIVFDSALQKFDAGRRPASMIYGGKPSFSAPADENLLDVTARVCASNWMGRAWTLQEGVLSRHLVFPLNGSLAYLRVLWPHHDEGLSVSKLWTFAKEELDARLDHGLAVWRDGHNLPAGVAAPMWNQVRHDLLTFVNDSLNVHEYHDYARGSTDRAARFASAHHRLQSRTTTMMQDLPLILMNMSGMNGNLVAQSGGSEDKMKLLIYGLGTIPIELLFSDCARLGRCGTDSWIPLEIVPETFLGNHFLRLGAAGFTFHQEKGDKNLDFYSVSRSAVWRDEVLLYMCGGPEDGERRYIAKAGVSQTAQGSSSAAKNGWCILLDTWTDRRAARFMISRRSGNKVFLHFDCPLWLTEVLEGDSEQAKELPDYMCIARRADSSDVFIIERSPTPEFLSMARPQNPSQYLDRLSFAASNLYFGLGYLERRALVWYFGEDFESTWNWWIIISHLIFCSLSLRWIEQGLDAFAHRAWILTYSPTWTPSGPWKWFWKVSNYEPPVPFMTINKWFCKLGFLFFLLAEFYQGVVTVTLYWFLFYPTEELVGMYVIGLVCKAAESYFA